MIHKLLAVDSEQYFVEELVDHYLGQLNEYVQKDDWIGVYPEFTNAQEAADAIRNPNIRLKVYCKIAKAAQEAGLSHEAKEIFKKAEQCIHKLGAPSGIATLNIYFEFASCLIEAYLREECAYPNTDLGDNTPIIITPKQIECILKAIQIGIQQFLAQCQADRQSQQQDLLKQIYSETTRRLEKQRRLLNDRNPENRTNPPFPPLISQVQTS